MANVDAPAGFRPLRHLGGGTARANEYDIASAYGSNIFTGDTVLLATDGTIQLATNGTRILGVFGGVKYTESDGEMKFSRYWPASTVSSDAKALVYDDPLITFGVQCATSITATEVGGLADHVSTTGNTLTGQSAMELSGTTGTGSAGFRVLGLVKRPDNAYGVNVDLEVQIFEHEFAYHGQTNPGVG